MLQFILEAVLVEGVFAEEVDGGKTETSSTQTALHHLEDLGTEGEGAAAPCLEGARGQSSPGLEFLHALSDSGSLVAVLPDGLLVL